MMKKHTTIFQFRPNGIKSLLLMLLLLVMGAHGAWGQPDCSGTYYIGSVGYKEANTTTNFYLCPTEGWCYYQATDNFTGTDNGMPFLTTYHCRDGVYDVRKAIWTIEKAPAPNEAYYYIKQASTGRYLTSNGKINTTNNADRLRVHLETVAPENLDDKELFTIESDNGHYVISPKDVVGGAADRKWLVVNGGNQNALTGQSGKQNGPTGYTNTAGIIGVYTKTDGNAPFYLEEAIIPPTFTLNSDGSVALSSEGGTTIRYTTDGATPTAESTAYTSAIQVTSTMTSIKAIAIRTSDNKASDAVTLPLHTYTYYIVNKSGGIAIKQVVKLAEGKALGSMADIPADIRSPYLIGETVKFYSFNEAFTSAEQLTDEVKISTTPQADANIYVTYTTDRLSEKFLRLRGARAFNFVTNDGYAYDNGGTLAYDNVETNKTQTNHLWNISGGDPYAVQIDNLSTGKYLVSSTMPTLSLAETATNNFILMEESAVTGAGSESVKLMKATGTEDIVVTKAEFQASPVNITTKYNLIDKAGKLIQGNIESESSELGLPDEWRSPLVSEYHYYKTSGYNEATQTYTPANPITSPFDADGGMIFVTYDVSDAVDLTGGKTYLLKFLNGVSFYQENGSDGIIESSYKAVYPYNNGEFHLYVYGQEQWDAQLSSGASTRTRWLWHILSNHEGNNLTGSAIDPYHVIFKSEHDQTVKDKKDVEGEVVDHNYSGNTYLRTYKPASYGSVVTDVAYESEEYYNDYPQKMNNSRWVNGGATEYMILGTSMLNMKLKTFGEIDGARQTVTSFEQYWKNNPTANNLLAANGIDKVTGEEETVSLTSAQRTFLQSANASLHKDAWHSDNVWAYTKPWEKFSNGSTDKALKEGEHWLQTISMGSGEFTLEEVSLVPQVILIDQHGWEIMRVPMYSDNACTAINTDALNKYNSPMVQTYHWYPKADKVSGYHKYKVNDSYKEIIIYYKNEKNKWVDSSRRYTHTSTSLSDVPYDHISDPVQDKSVKTDFYVTYTVKSEYDNAYTGAATSDAAVPSAYLLKQRGSYASTNGSAITATTAPASMEDIPNVMQWNLRPNFDIDREMGYKYAGEAGAQDGAKSKEATDQDNYDEGRNGFDPYNVQIQSVAYPLRYFTANTEGIALDGGKWKGTSSTINFQNLNTKQTADGYDQTKLNITNATFMVVDDGAGNMRLMPRFDNSKVVTFSSTPFKTLETQTTAATTGDKGTGPQTLWLELVPKALEIHSSSEITEMNGHYLLAQDFAFDEGFTSLGTSEQPFRGIIDGQLNTLSGTSVPLVAYADGAIIRNVILEEVDISTGTNVGAICCEAKGATRIYNCGINSGSVGGTGKVGGLVGLLDGTSRVINCYSYADITGGSDKGGIVGYNSVASKQSDVATMVMNCMFYGTIATGDNVSPVYGGKNIDNKNSGGLATYNYYLYRTDLKITDNMYNCALAVEEKFLNRFELYRLLLNSNKKLAAIYATGSAANADQMAKWVLETADRSIDGRTPYPYPILKTQGYYPSIINYDVENAPDSVDVGRNHGGKLGKTLSVTIKAPGEWSNAPSNAKLLNENGNEITTSRTITLTRTDKDFDRFNFNYDKVQLPYYNDYGTKNYTGNRVVTGWKITDIDGGTSGTFTAADSWGGYNFADRLCTNKDLYGTNGSNRVFSQGAYFEVPYGVTAITIEPYWGVAAYVSDQYYDVVYKEDGDKNYAGQNVNVVSAGLGTQATNEADITINGSTQKVYTSIDNARKSMSISTSTTSGKTVYDYAVVLVGNVHQAGPLSGDYTPYTITSVDLDKDNEPDYSFIFSHHNRQAVSPIRFDFLNVVGTAQAQKPNGTSRMLNVSIFKPKGWFEVTNTCSIYFVQFEGDNGSKTSAPIILLGGAFDQFTSTQSQKVTTSQQYIHLGSNCWFKAFGNGTHGDGFSFTSHVPVSVTGGDFDGFYLSGVYRPDAGIQQDNAECYISSGRFNEVAGAAQQMIDGDVHWQIYDADITNFYGGGINAAKPITGDITVDIFNSHVDTYCGGPKFGDMQKKGTTFTTTYSKNKEGSSTGTYSRAITKDGKVTTNATGCEFNKFFGAGYGGTSYSELKFFDDTGYNFTNLQNNYTGDRGKYFNGTNASYKSSYGNKGSGVATDFSYEFFIWSRGQVGARFYVKYASFSLAQCNDVESKLKKCVIENNFYGGGSIGKVAGTVTSELDGCKVKGNVFGAGYSASLPTTTVRNAGFTTVPKFNNQSGMFEPGVFSDNTDFNWTSGTLTENATAINESGENQHDIYTNINLSKSNLGSVAGNVNLTIKGKSVIGTAGDTTGEKGNVFGGGESSYVTTNPNITNQKVTVNLEGEAEVLGNVFGGGDKGEVQCSTEVNIRQTAPTTTDPEP